MPGSHAYPTGAWLPFLAGPYNEVAKNSQGTKYPPLQELRENSDARLLVIRQETMRSFRSMRAQWMTSISVILQEESVLKASTTVTPPPPPENGEDDDRDEEDDDRDEGTTNVTRRTTTVARRTTTLTATTAAARRHRQRKCLWNCNRLFVGVSSAASPRTLCSPALTAKLHKPKRTLWILQ